MKAGWFLDSVQIKVPNQGKHYMFPSHRWLSEDEVDGKTEVELYPSEILDVEKCIHFTLYYVKTIHYMYMFYYICFLIRIL